MEQACGRVVWSCDLCKLSRRRRQISREPGLWANSTCPGTRKEQKMKSRIDQSKPGMPIKQQEIVCQLLRLTGLLIFAVAVVFVATAALALTRQLTTPQTSQSTSMPNVQW